MSMSPNKLKNAVFMNTNKLKNAVFMHMLKSPLALKLCESHWFSLDFPIVISRHRAKFVDLPFKVTRHLVDNDKVKVEDLCTIIEDYIHGRKFRTLLYLVMKLQSRRTTIDPDNLHFDLYPMCFDKDAAIMYNYLIKTRVVSEASMDSIKSQHTEGKWDCKKLVRKCSLRACVNFDPVTESFVIEE